MTEKLCLRCDWSGETKNAVCPTCGAGLFRPPGAPAPRRRWRLPRPRRARADEAAGLATPAPESFDPSAPDRSEAPIEAPLVVGRRGWIAGAAILVVAIAAGILVEGATPPPPPTAPAAGLRGDLLLLGPDSGGRTRMWIWDLATGAIRRGPSLDDPVQLVDAFAVEPGDGWVGVVSQGREGQTAGLLRNFGTADVPGTVLEGDLVSWTTDGAAVVAATKPAEPCSTLHVESVSLGLAMARVRLDRPICGDLTAVALEGVVPFVGLEGKDGGLVARVWGGRARPWVTDAEMVAVRGNGGVLVVPDCDDPQGEVACGGLAYADPPSPVYPYMDPDVGILSLDRFLGWGRDGRTGYVLGTFGDVRGIYAVTPLSRPRPPRLVVASDAAQVSLAEAYGPTVGDLFVSEDGRLLLIRTDGERVPLTLPDDVPAPVGPIAWVAAVGED